MKEGLQVSCPSLVRRPEPGPGLHTQHGFSEQVFLGEMIEGERGKMRSLERAKCLLRGSETGSLLMHEEKHSCIVLYPDLLLLMEPCSMPLPTMALFSFLWEPVGTWAFTNGRSWLLG